MCISARIFTLMLIILSFPLILYRYLLGGITTVARWDQDLQQINPLLEKLQTVYILREWLALPVVRPHPWLFWTMERWAVSTLSPLLTSPLSVKYHFLYEEHEIVEGRCFVSRDSLIANWLLIEEYLEGICSSVWVFKLQDLSASKDFNVSKFYFGFCEIQTV